MRAILAGVAAAWTIAGLTACAPAIHVPSPAAPVLRETSTTVRLHGKPLVLHLARPAVPGATPPAALVLYASGDGGWFGTAVQMFRALAAEGQPVVGLSSRAFLKIERPAGARLSPEQLRLDYAVVLDAARQALGLPASTPAILTGWSRGAAFAVLAAAQDRDRTIPTAPAGVVAIGLADGEDLAIDGPEDESDDAPGSPGLGSPGPGSPGAGSPGAGSPGAGSPRPGAAPFAPYAMLAHDVDVPAAVVQASGDGYLPAGRARALFGRDGPTRRFFEVPGRNHRFDGAGRELGTALSQALQWILAGLGARRRSGMAALAVVTTLTLASPTAAAPATAPTPQERTETVTVRGHALTVHTYGTRGGRPIVVTSGDGGWIHLGPYVADTLARHGCFVVGIDARAYLSSFTGGSTTLRPEDEPGDYRVFAEFAGRGSATRPILVGVSEGAGLSLLAATDPHTRPAIAGVIGLGLPDLNELGWHWRDALIYLTHGTPNEPLFSTVRLAPQVAPLPLAAIHSTHDEFVPLADAQRIVDAAHEPKRLWIIEAADHRFSNALPELDRRLGEAIAWITNTPAGAVTRGVVRAVALVRGRVGHVLPALISLLVFAVALAVLRVELRTLRWSDLVAAVLSTPRPRLLLAVGLTALNYGVLAGYDLLAFATIGRALARRRIAGAAVVAYAISHTVGFAALSGASVRYRFYSRWGVTAAEMTQVVISYSVTFWVGLLALGGVSLAFAPLPDVAFLPAPLVTRAIGGLLLAAVAAYLVACVVRRGAVRIGPLVAHLPRPALAFTQVALSVTDWLLAGSILYLLLPAGAPPFLAVLGAFLAAVLIGMASHVPGGVGVFEGLMVLWLRPWLPASALLPTFVVYRAVYYLLPFLGGVLALVADEARQRRAHLTRAAGWMGRLTQQLTPRVLAAFTFLAGVVLLVSGATPAAPGRLDLLDRLLPLGVIETSHFVGSIAGAGLLVLSHGLARRLDAAYYTSSLLIVVGMGASLLKGFDVEEAALLLGVLLILRRARPAFDRRAAFFETRFSPGWIAAVAGTLGASVWLGRFAFDHVDYAADLWWRFELTGEASRALRASVGAAVVVLLAGLARLLGHVRHAIEAPDDDAIDEAAAMVAAHPATSANLVFLRDKGLIVDDEQRGFVMYGVQGRTWVAMGDPVGPPAAQRALIRRFLERVDDYDGTPVFYQIGHAGLHRYADFGLTFVKLGEEALVDLPSFTLEGSAGARARQTVRRLERDNGTFRLIAPEDVAAHLPALRRVSNDWLTHKAVAEKGFSLGFFDDAYVARFPAGVIERDGEIQAFATLWPGAPGSELSVDLMRFASDAPKNVMEALLVHVMLWGRSQGYQQFSLGMAPLSGFDRSLMASRWQKLGAFVYDHGEAFYGFQGLRAFKEKFAPHWEPRYLACPGGLALPRVLADVSALIAGGYRRIFVRAPGQPASRYSAALAFGTGTATASSSDTATSYRDTPPAGGLAR